MALKISDVLERASNRISKPGAWTQHAYARTARGKTTRIGSRNAVCWCAVGAIRREVGQSRDWSPFKEALEKHLVDSGYLPGPIGIASWNDRPNQTQDHIVSTLRKCASKLRKVGK